MVRTDISTIAEIECESDSQSNKSERKSRRSQSLDRLGDQSVSGLKTGRKAHKQLMSLVRVVVDLVAIFPSKLNGTIIV